MKAPKRGNVKLMRRWVVGDKVCLQIMLYLTLGIKYQKDIGKLCNQIQVLPQVFSFHPLFMTN